MIQTVNDFVDSSAFERSALAIVYPLVDQQTGQARLDLRSAETQVHILVTDSLGEGARNAIIQELRPLLFGAAWKVIDLLIEYGLNQVTPRPEWAIADKRREAGNAVVNPLSSDRDIWTRVTALYANTVEARHCLVHRQFVFSAAGDMTHLVDRKGKPMPDVGAEEQVAFCRVAQRAAAILQLGRFDPRDRLDMVAWLDKVAAHHGLGVLGTGALSRPPQLVQVNAQQGASGWTVDIANAWASAEEVFPGRKYFDIEITFPGTGLPLLRGRLEDAPRNSAVLVDPVNPPSWVDP